MKKYINRNYFWADLFVGQISELGCDHVIISPGSRNTPLTIAFANNKKFKKFIHVDERSGSFFALGVAKNTKNPVVIVTTSGTAVAELYPAIIEAYQQRIPIIVCTADRPVKERNKGANQTINQDNIFTNHIRDFVDFGLPSLNKTKIRSLINKTFRSFIIGYINSPGPIHFNFPFNKPLEPSSFTENIDYRISDFIKKIEFPVTKNLKTDSLVKNIIDRINESKRVLIHCGWDNYKNDFFKEINLLSAKCNIPVLVDGTCSLRFYKGNHNIVNHSAFINYLKLQPDLIIQFGNPPTSQSVLKFLEKAKADRIIINEYGDIKDPSGKCKKVIKICPSEMVKKLNCYNFNSVAKEKWNNYIINCEVVSEKIKSEVVNNSQFGLEPVLVNKIMNQIPENSNIFISNSLPIRDFDFFSSKNERKINIFTNRGASGIDGIISTASGVAATSDEKTFLVIGDLSFYHNISALSYIAEKEISISILLINNYGGGIFNMLPVTNEKKYFNDYFITEQKLDFKKIVKAFGVKYQNPKTWKGLRSVFSKINKVNESFVIELTTDSKKSLELRKQYWNNIKAIIENVK